MRATKRSRPAAPAVPLTVEDVLAVHGRLCADFAADSDPIEPPGVRDRGLLESAVARQFTGWGHELKYPTAIENAATLTFGLCNDHPFHNGNKRTALVSMLAHLDRNGLCLDNTRQNELYRMVLALADNRLSAPTDARKRRRSSVRRSADAEVKALSVWLDRRVHPVVRGERAITFRQLDAILRRFDYFLDNPRKNSIDICRMVEKRRGPLRRKVVEQKSVTNIPFPGMSKTVSPQRVKYVRRYLNLTEVEGVDSRSFYDGAEVVDVFINEYRTILRRLATK